MKRSLSSWVLVPTRVLIAVGLTLAVWLVVEGCGSAVQAQDQSTTKEQGTKSKTAADPQAASKSPSEGAGASKAKTARRTLDEKLLADLDPQRPNRGFVRLGKAQVEIDSQRKVLVIEGTICLREGQLELFACPKGTKEHESILSLATDATTVHAGLLAIGAEPGAPVKYNPEYVPASGPIVDIYVVWVGEDGKQKQMRAQEWVRSVQTKKELDSEWVFGGSSFNVNEETGERYYLANSGDLICVSNFATAALDLQIRSSQANAELMFEAFTDRIPPKGTKVRLLLLPRESGKPKPADPKSVERRSPTGGPAPTEKPTPDKPTPEKPTTPSKSDAPGKKGTADHQPASNRLILQRAESE